MAIWRDLGDINLNESRYTKPILICHLIVSCLVTLYVTFPCLKDPFVVDNDLRANMYWAYKFRDPELFNDYLSKRTIHNTYRTSPGYVFLYYIASFFMDPVLFAKILPFVLCPLTIVFLFKIGKLICDNATGLLASLFVIPFLHGTVFSGGLNRSFSWPTLIALVYYLIRRRFLLAGLILILQALFYPPIFLLSTVIYVLSIISVLFLTRKSGGIIHTRRMLLLAIGAILVSLIILSPTVLRQLNLLREKPEMSSFGESGRYPVFSAKKVVYGSLAGNLIRKLRQVKLPAHFFFGRGGIVGDRGDGEKVTPLLLAGLLSLLVLGKECFRLDQVAYNSALSSCILYVAAWFFLPALYFPGKYKFGLILFLILFAARGVEMYLRSLPFLTKRRIGVATGFFMLCLAFYPSFLCSKKILLIVMGTVISFLILATIFRKIDKGLPYYNGVLFVSLFLVLLWGASFKMKGYVYPNEVQRNLCRYVSSLPKSTLIAGHPGDPNLDNIPLLSKRAVFLNGELFGPLVVRGMDNEIEERACQNVDTYYSDSWDQVFSFSEKYGVSHWLINEKYFSKV